MSDTEQTNPGIEFHSKLTDCRARFLAYVIEHSLAVGRRTASDFIRHFPPSAIMTGLKDQPRLRAGILVLTTGLKQRIAVKKVAAAAADDLQMALDEGETDAQSIVTLFNPDDRVRYLDARTLWSFVIEGEFWNTSPSKKEEFERAKEHIAFMIDRALSEKLLTHRDIVDGITVEELVSRLPKAELGKIITQALASGRQDTAFRDEDLVAATPSSTLVRFIPLSHVYKSVIEPKIARAHGYMEAASAEHDWERMESSVPMAAGGGVTAPGSARKEAPNGNGSASERPAALVEG
jgi:hypothetical protein